MSPLGWIVVPVFLVAFALGLVAVLHWIAAALGIAPEFLSIGLWIAALVAIFGSR